MKLKGFTVLTPDHRPLGFYDHQTPEGAVAEAMIEAGHSAEPSENSGYVDLTGDHNGMIAGVYVAVKVPTGEITKIEVG